MVIIFIIYTTMSLVNYATSGAVKELEGWWKSIVQVTIKPSNAQTEGTRPKPNLVIEGGN